MTHGRPGHTRPKSTRDASNVYGELVGTLQAVDVMRRDVWRTALSRVGVVVPRPGSRARSDVVARLVHLDSAMGRALRCAERCAASQLVHDTHTGGAVFVRPDGLVRRLDAVITQAGYLLKRRGRSKASAWEVVARMERDLKRAKAQAEDLDATFYGGAK